jgi:NAD(P)-dependent dehydrogenase (short-subunit alcohol dehydrogenase family)
MKYVVLITGASSGFGLLTARSLAHAGHTVYASMRETAGRNAPQSAEVAAYAKANDIDLRTVELDVGEQASVDAAVAAVIAEAGRLDVIVHNAGHMTFGPAEAFTPEQMAALFDVNVLSTQRLNRAVLPHMRARGEGLVVWVSSSSAKGATPPYLGPYFAAKAAMDQMAVSYAGELVRFGVDTSIVVPGAFTKGTNHFAHAGQPADTEAAKAYAEGLYSDIPDAILKGLTALEPVDADVQKVADAIVEVVATPRGHRPYRVFIDPSEDGAEVVAGVQDRVRSEMLRRMGLDDLVPTRIR